MNQLSDWHHLCGLGPGGKLRKWQTLIEAHVDVKTTDNYVVRLSLFLNERKGVCL